MEDLLYFVEHFTLDSHLYYRIDGYEIQWRRVPASLPWRYRPADREEWLHCSKADIVPALQSEGVNIETFEEQLRQSVAAQAIFADVVLENARRTLGAYAVAVAIADSKQFAKDLVKVVKDLTRPSLRLI